MSITTATIKQVAHLARIYIEPKDIAKFEYDLSEILDLVEQMDAVPTDEVKPLAHPQDITLRFRADQVTETSARNELQAGAPAVKEGFYLVPKIIE